MATTTNLKFARLLLSLSVLFAFAGVVYAHTPTSAQIAPGDGEGQAQPAKTDGTILQEPEASPTSINNKAAAASGHWVPRINSKTCPKGSTAFIDEKNGGVKCWVKDT